MSKKLLTSYTFDASAQTIVSADFTSLEKIQLITNVTDQIIIYNFADTAKGGSLSGTTLTLEHDTTLMDDTDKLQIFVEDAVAPITMVGNAAHDAADSGNPVKVGGKYNSSDPSLSDGDRGDLQLNNQGKLKIIINDTVNSQISDNSGSDNVSSAAASPTQNVEGRGSASINIGGTWDGTITFQGSSDNSTYFTIAGIDQSDGTVDSTTTGNGTWRFNVAGLNGIRANMTSYNSGTATIKIRVGGGSAGGIVRTDPTGITTQPVSGTVTANLSAVDNAVLDQIELNQDTQTGVLNTIDADTGAMVTDLAAIETLLTTIDGDTSNLSVVGGGTEAAAIRVTIANNSTGVLSIDDNGSTVSIDDGGGVITVDGTVAVTNSDITSIKTAVEILDNAISGSEMQVDLASAIPAGTNAIGKLLPPDVDVTAHTNYKKFYYTNAGAVTDGIVWSPAAGKRWHILWMVINVSADATVTFEDDKAAGDEVVMKAEIAGKSGFPVTCPEKYPLASGEDAADLLITTTAGNVYIFGVGYEV